MLLIIQGVIPPYHPRLLAWSVFRAEAAFPFNSLFRTQGLSTLGANVMAQR